MNCKHEDIELITYWDEESKMRLVSHGVCTYCLKSIVLPPEPVSSFKRIDNYRFR